jgi:uncharacterized membrane protein YeaQ/YmgE (transglycosylase-associated protein family)
MRSERRIGAANFTLPAAGRAPSRHGMADRTMPRFNPRRGSCLGRHTQTPIAVLLCIYRDTPGRSQTLPRSNRMFAFIGTLIVGLIVGLIARAIKPGDDNMGWIMTIVLGIVGSLVAGYVGRALGWYQPGQAAGWIASVIGAIILLVVWGFVRKRMA